MESKKWGAALKSSICIKISDPKLTKEVTELHRKETDSEFLLSFVQNTALSFKSSLSHSQVNHKKISENSNNLHYNDLC